MSVNVVNMNVYGECSEYGVVYVYVNENVH